MSGGIIIKLLEIGDKIILKAKLEKRIYHEQGELFEWMCTIPRRLRDWKEVKQRFKNWAEEKPSA